MKESSVEVAPTREYSPQSQCVGKKPYKFKRRAIEDSRGLAKDTGLIFTVYHCPHCKKYHVGSVRV